MLAQRIRLRGNKHLKKLKIFGLSLINSWISIGFGSGWIGMKYVGMIILFVNFERSCILMIFWTIYNVLFSLYFVKNAVITGGGFALLIKPLGGWSKFKFIESSRVIKIVNRST